MKIGLLTFYRAANYGGLLQAYALERYLTARGHDVYFIEDESLYPKRPNLIRSLIARSRRGVRIKLDRWLSFRKAKFAAHARFCGYDDVAFDAVVVGSDQVWNPKWYGSPAMVEKLFLGWVGCGVKRIAYAASFGCDKWCADCTAGRVGDLLKQFSGISVREEGGKAIVSALSGRTDVRCLPDPSLLLPVNMYWEIAGDCETKGPYVFYYMLDWSKGTAEKIALDGVCRELKCRQVLTDRGAAGLLAVFGKIGIDASVTVPEWLSRIAHCHFVVTNSYHGALFSLIFHRPFVVFKIGGEMSGMNERVETLLRFVGMSERFVDVADKAGLMSVLSSRIDWQSVDKSLMLQRKAADDYFHSHGV